MCLAMPGRLTAIENGEGIVDYGALARRAELCLVPQARVGDMVLVHAGFAIAVLDPREGRELEALAREVRSFAPAPAPEADDA